MIECAAVVIAINFLTFASTIIGEAIKTTINKSIELKLEDRYSHRNNNFVQDSYKCEDKLLREDSLSRFAKINPTYTNKFCHTNQGMHNTPRAVYYSAPKPIVIFNSPNLSGMYHRFNIISQLKEIRDIHFADINRFDSHLKELLEVPVILVNIKASTAKQILCDIHIWNIIPGISDTQILQLIFDLQNYTGDLQEFDNKVTDYIITVIRVIKDTFAYCRLPLKDSLERLRLEANILSEMGYDHVEFYKNNNGYISKLSGLFNKEIVIHIGNEYPFSPPIMLMREDDSFRNIELPNEVWSPDCTIGQLISAINKS